jgi:DNA polymerase
MRELPQLKRKVANEKLDVLRNPDCSMCSLHQSSENVCIRGNGDPTSSLVLYGEAPGKREAETGQPFRGASGRLLDEALRRLGISRRKVFVSNVVRCRPPENRKPSKRELEICSSLFLREELMILHSSVAIALGKTATEILLPWHEKPIRGKVYREGTACLGVTVIPTYHPAFILRCGGLDNELGGYFMYHLKKGIETCGSI